VDEEHRASVEGRLAVARLLDDDTQLEDLDAAANLLVVADDVTRVSVLGFCMGGYYTFKAAATGRFDAAVAYYGMLRTPEGWRGPGHKADPIDLAAQMCPTLAIFGSNDPYTPPEDIAALREAWKDRDDCEIIVVEGAEHGFVHDPDRPIHRADDAAELWPRTIAWLRG
jgi:carboxymethylenebutenolidase